MKKGLMIGSLVLGAAAIVGFTGCETEKKYNVTFDSNPEITEDNVVIEFKDGDSALENIPTPLEKDGFAGVWEDFKLTNEDITVNAVYGDGTQANPYLVAKASQFKTILNDHTYTSEDVEEATYKYFKFIADVDLAEIEELETLELAGKYFKGEINGNGFKLLNLDGSRLVSTEGSLFANLFNATFKNLNVYLGSNIGTIASYVRGGSNIIENVNIYNMEGVTASIVSSNDNNESPYVFHVLGSSSLSFRNCVNNANYINYSSYCGLFVGGYAQANTSVSFDGCVNNGSAVSAGKMGMFFGNNAQTPANLSISNCEFNGTIKTVLGTHILSADARNNGVFGNVTVSHYDSNKENVLSGLNQDSLQPLTSKYTATITNEDLKVEAEAIDAGKYELVLSAFAINGNGSTLLTNIVIEKTNQDGTATELDFSDTIYAMMDLNTFNSTYSKAVKSTYAEDYVEDEVQWVQIKGYNIKYALIDGVYVIDYTQFDKDHAYTSATTINVGTENLAKVIIVTVDNTIDFIVNF